MKGGVADALERIRAAFHQLHGDVRDRAGVEADRQMQVEIANDAQTVELRKTECAEKVRIKTARLADAFVQSALRAPHIHHVPSQRDSNGCYEVEVPSESSEELINEALHDLMSSDDE